MSLQSPMVAEGDAEMMNSTCYRPADTVERARRRYEPLLIWGLCHRPSPDGIHDTSKQNRAENDRGDASRFEDGKLPKLLRIDCHAGIIDGSRTTALI
jgi:hypothetical protein